jgi:hypothetical protein
VKFIEELMAIKTDKLGPETLLAANFTSHLSLHTVNLLPCRL